MEFDTWFPKAAVGFNDPMFGVSKIVSEKPCEFCGTSTRWVDERLKIPVCCTDCQDALTERWVYDLNDEYDDSDLIEELSCSD